MVEYVVGYCLVTAIGTVGLGVSCVVYFPKANDKLV